MEDEPLIAMLFEDVLTDMGHVVVATAMTEVDAVSLALDLKPYLIFVDHRLGEGSGVAALRQILHHGFIPHIFTSGDAQNPALQQEGSIGISKPFREDELMRAITLAMNTG